MLDTTPPVTTDNANPGGVVTWHAGPWTLTLSPSDPLATDGSHAGMVGGPAKTEYSTDGGVTWVTGTSLDYGRWRRGGGSGVFSVLYRSTDAAGNTETPQSATVRIDNSLPTATNDAPSGTQTGPVTVHISGHDSFSGVAFIWYSLDGGTWTQVAYPGGVGVPVAISGNGAHTLCYYAVDGAGNLQAGFSVCSVTIQSGGSAPLRLLHRIKVYGHR